MIIMAFFDSWLKLNVFGQPTYTVLEVAYYIIQKILILLGEGSTKKFLTATLMVTESTWQILGAEKTRSKAMGHS